MPTSITTLYICSKNTIKDNLPEHIKCLYIYFSYHSTENDYFTNLPPILKEIRINDTKHKDYITKIPFGCKIFDWNGMPIDI